MFRIKFNRKPNLTEKELLMTIEAKLDQILANQTNPTPIDLSAFATSAEMTALTAAVSTIGTQLTALAAVVGTEAAAAVSSATTTTATTAAS